MGHPKEINIEEKADPSGEPGPRDDTFRVCSGGALNLGLLAEPHRLKPVLLELLRGAVVAAGELVGVVDPVVIFLDGGQRAGVRVHRPVLL
jgi:hypothetical protein